MARRKLQTIRQGTIVVSGNYTDTRLVEQDRPDGPPQQVRMPLYESFTVTVDEAPLRRVLKGLATTDTREGVLETGQVTFEFGLSNEQKTQVVLPLNTRLAEQTHVVTASEKATTGDRGLFTYFAMGHVDVTPRNAR